MFFVSMFFIILCNYGCKSEQEKRVECEQACSDKATAIVEANSKLTQDFEEAKKAKCGALKSEAEAIYAKFASDAARCIQAQSKGLEQFARAGKAAEAAGYSASATQAAMAVGESGRQESEAACAMADQGKGKLEKATKSLDECIEGLRPTLQPELNCQMECAQPQ